MRDFQDPATNGVGHPVDYNQHGQKCVVVPASRVVKRRRQTVSEAVWSNKVDDGEDQLQEGILAEKFQQMWCMMHTALAITLRPQAGQPRLLHRCLRRPRSHARRLHRPVHRLRRRRLQRRLPSSVCRNAATRTS